MSAILRPVFRAVGLGLVCASVAGAQEKACEVNESRPNQIGRATLAVQVASSAQDPAAITKQLSAAVKGLTENADRMDNQVGRNFVLGKALVLWSLQPNVELVTTRGALGYTADPQGTIDIAAAIDTASRTYRWFLYALATVPMIGLFLIEFRTVQKTYAILGANDEFYWWIDLAGDEPSAVSTIALPAAR